MKKLSEKEIKKIVAARKGPIYGLNKKYSSPAWIKAPFTGAHGRSVTGV